MNLVWNWNVWNDSISKTKGEPQLNGKLITIIKVKSISSDSKVELCGSIVFYGALKRFYPIEVQVLLRRKLQTKNNIP